MDRTATIITVSMGRLDHLKQSLPAMLRQKCEVVVVDYSCPEGSGTHVEKQFPEARVVRVSGQQVFSNWKARNAGAACATSGLMIFCEADIILKEGAVAELVAALPEQSFGRFNKVVPAELVTARKGLAGNQLRGFQVVPREAFERIGGYDEVLEAYASGGDTDLACRLSIAGLQPFDVDPGIFSAVVEHGDGERVRNHRRGPGISYAASSLYLQLKYAFMRMTGQLECPLETRRRLYQQALAEGRKLRSEDHVSMTMSFSEESLRMAPVLRFDSVARSYSVTVELRGANRRRSPGTKA